MPKEKNAKSYLDIFCPFSKCVSYGKNRIIYNIKLIRYLQYIKGRFLNSKLSCLKGLDSAITNSIQEENEFILK